MVLAFFATTSASVAAASSARAAAGESGESADPFGLVSTSEEAGGEEFRRSAVRSLRCLGRGVVAGLRLGLGRSGNQ